MIVDSMPNAIVAQSVQGLERTSILQTNTTGTTQLTQANLAAAFTGPAYTNLLAIGAGNFMPKSSSAGASTLVHDRSTARFADRGLSLVRLDRERDQVLYRCYHANSRRRWKWHHVTHRRLSTYG